MLPLWCIYIAALMRVGGGLAYFKATLQGKAKPNPVSWLLWSVTPLITFFVGLNAGVGTEMIITLASGISPLLVFFASIYKNPKSLKLSGLNLLCVIVACAAIIFWSTTNIPEIAIALLLAADLFSSLPTIIKAAKQPKTEFAPTYLISATSMLVALLTMSEWKFAAIAYPLYALATNMLIVMLIKRPRPSKPQQSRRRKVSRR